MAAPIAVVGNLNLDIRTSPIAAGEALLRDGETGVEEIYETVGGGGANTAAAIIGMGGQAHLSCAVGDDGLGRRLAAFLGSMGVRVHGARKAAATGRSIALSFAAHQRHFVSSLPACRLLEETDVDLHALQEAGCRHLYRADPWFADLMLPAGNVSLLRRAREAGMETSLDINWDPLWSLGEQSGRAQERIAWLRLALPFVSYVHGNERELGFFTGGRSPEGSARLLLEWGAGAVIVHRGSRGSAAATAGGWVEAPAAPVSRIVTETGSGDVFTAAFLLCPEQQLQERLRSAAAAAARHLEGKPCYIPRLREG